MPTALQIKLIHVAKREAGLNDPQYRTLLKNVAKVDSAKLLGQDRFERCMGVLESLGFRDREHGPGYWAKKAERTGECTERMARKIETMALECRYDVKALCLRGSLHRTDQVRKLTFTEAWNLIEALKAIAQRNEDKDVRSNAGTTS